MENNFEIQVVVTNNLLGNGIRAYFRSRPFFIALMFLSFAAIALISIISNNVSLSDLNLLLKVSAISGVGFVVTFLSVYIISFNRSKNFFKKLGPNSTTKFQFDEIGVSNCNELIQSKIHWKFFHHLWRSKKLWLLFVAKQQFFILPTSQLSPDLQTFIITKLRENGVQIN